MIKREAAKENCQTQKDQQFSIENLKVVFICLTCTKSKTISAYNILLSFFYYVLNTKSRFSVRVFQNVRFYPPGARSSLKCECLSQKSDYYVTDPQIRNSFVVFVFGENARHTGMKIKTVIIRQAS